MFNCSSSHEDVELQLHSGPGDAVLRHQNANQAVPKIVLAAPWQEQFGPVRFETGTHGLVRTWHFQCYAVGIMRSHRITEDSIHVTSDHMGQHLLVRAFLWARHRPSCWESPLRPGFGPGKGGASYIAITCRRAFSCVIINLLESEGILRNPVAAWRGSN